MSQINFEVLSLLIQTSLLLRSLFALLFFLNIHEVKRNDNTNNSMPCGQLSSFSFTDDLLDCETTKSVVIIAISELNFIVRLAIMTMLL